MFDKIVNVFLVNATLVLPLAVGLALVASSTARRGLLGLIRILARPLLIAAVVALVYDGTRTMAGGSGIVVTSLGEHWAALSLKSLEVVKAFVVGKVHPLAWSSGIERVLALPAWLVIGLTGILLAWIGRRRKPIDIYVN